MENPMSGGTTATVCLVKNGVQLVVAHVGDSRAVLCRSNKACRLTQDHDPKVDSERERILKCNGHFSSASFGKSRVNGRLEMTRSIGDVELKPYGVIAEPEVRTIEVRFFYFMFTSIGNQKNGKMACTTTLFLPCSEFLNTTKYFRRFLVSHKWHLLLTSGY